VLNARPFLLLLDTGFKRFVEDAIEELNVAGLQFNLKDKNAPLKKWPIK